MEFTISPLHSLFSHIFAICRQRTRCERNNKSRTKLFVGLRTGWREYQNDIKISTYTFLLLRAAVFVRVFHLLPLLFFLSLLCRCLFFPPVSVLSVRCFVSYETMFNLHQNSPARMSCRVFSVVH